MHSLLWYWGAGIGAFILFFFQIWGGTSSSLLRAESSVEGVAESFLQALSTQDLQFFMNKGADQEFLEVLEDGFLLDIEVVYEKEWIFFSFLQKAQTSSVLINQYGVWNNISRSFVFLPSLSVAVQEEPQYSNEYQTVFVNTSPVAFPGDGIFFPLPSHTLDGTLLFSGNLIQPGESFRFTSSNSQLIPSLSPLFLESLKYGFKARVQ